MSRTDTLAIIIPTYCRPKALGEALDSALAQQIEGKRITVVVVDNDAYGSARPVAEGRARVTYVSEPRAGVSHARNAGLAATKARYIFFLDDDMIAERGCVAEAFRALRQHEAGVAFASVHARMPSDSALHAAMQPFFSRAPQLLEGPVSQGMGAGGSLIDLELCDLPSPAFDPAMNMSGGEDDRFFDHLAAHGTPFVWVPSAQTVESVPEHRATLRYVWKRNFAFGQGPTQLAHDRVAAGDRSAWRDVAKWMAVGLAQAALRLPVWCLAMTLQLPSRATAHAKLAQAFGKMFWWEGFRQNLYGPAATAG